MNAIAKRVVTALTVAALVVCGVLFAPPVVIAAVVAALGFLAVLEYGLLLARRLDPASVPFVGFFWLGSLLLAAAFAVLPVVAAAAPQKNLMLLYLLAIVKISDMGGFAFGVAFGRHKLCPSISPNKSWEGLAGSVFASCLVSSAFMPVTGFGWPKALGFGVAAALVGTFGDLVESKFKRWVGVKDSSSMRLTNGMGGMLDMFDSLLFAPGLLYWAA